MADQPSLLGRLGTLGGFFDKNVALSNAQAVQRQQRDDDWAERVALRGIKEKLQSRPTTKQLRG